MASLLSSFCHYSWHAFLYCCLPLISLHTYITNRMGYDPLWRSLGVAKDKNGKTQIVIPFGNFGFDTYLDEPKMLNAAVVEQKEKVTAAFPGLETLEPANLYAALLLSAHYSPANLNEKRFLEVGCGKGGGSVVLNALCNPKSYLGIDTSSAGIDLCKQHYSSSTTQFRVGNAINLEDVCEEGSFDIVYNLESSHTYPDFQRFSDGVHKVLAPEGLFLWADLVTSDITSALGFGCSFNSRMKSFNKSGFAIERIININRNVCSSLQNVFKAVYHKPELLQNRNEVWKSFSWSVYLRALLLVIVFRRIYPRFLEASIMEYYIVVLRKR